MKTLFRIRFFALLTSIVLFITPAQSQMLWDPLDGITKVVGWFEKLNGQFDKIIDGEKKGQLLRKSDRIRKELYALETDTQVVLDNITDEPPNLDRSEYLLTLSTELLRTVQRLSFAVREFGADLRVNDANDVEIALTIGLRVRGGSLTFLRKSIEDSKQGNWNAPEIRKQVGRGLQAVKAAQVSVSAFSQRLRSSK